MANKKTEHNYYWRVERLEYQASKTTSNNQLIPYEYGTLLHTVRYVLCLPGCVFYVRNSGMDLLVQNRCVSYYGSVTNLSI